MVSCLGFTAEFVSLIQAVDNLPVAVATNAMQHSSRTAEAFCLSLLSLLLSVFIRASLANKKLNINL